VAVDSPAEGAAEAEGEAGRIGSLEKNGTKSRFFDYFLAFLDFAVNSFSISTASREIFLRR
jgi:hypothetical protein